MNCKNMATINYYLDKPDKKGCTPIHLRINCNSSQIKMSTGKKIQPEFFDKITQEVISTHTKHQEINHNPI